VLVAVCEGQTERSYLDRLNDRYAAELGFSIQLAPQYSRGQNYNGYKPLGAAETAVGLRTNAKSVSAELWVVFDRDENAPQGDLRRVPSGEAERNRGRLLTSLL
jgi:hypothetical protein